MMSLRWRLLGAFILIIVLAVSLSVGVGYYTAQRQLDAFIGELSRIEANNLAQNLSRAYTLVDGWGALEATLFEAGYLYNEASEHDGSGEGEREGGDEDSEFFHVDRIRVVVVDVEGMVVLDNFSELASGVVAPDLDGHLTPIVDLRTNQPVGYAYVDVNREFLATESLGFLRELLYNSAIGGMLIAAIALLLAAWLSRRITAPVTALTQATQAIAQHGDTTLLPVTTSDELGQMSAAFNQMTTALGTQRDLRKRLINDVSHELNTPLSVIHLEAKGLSDGLQTPAQAADHIIQEVNTLRNLVRDLNWLAETDSGDLRLTLEPCSIIQLLASEVERWRQQAQMQQITLSLGWMPELPMLKLDRMRMSQALGNVARNALQHTEAGGRVTMEASMEENDGVGISVTDDGEGVDSTDLPHIFNRFYRTDQSRNRRTGGTGVGLAIARAIIEAHNGTITLTSDGLGKGTTVQIYLPIHTTKTAN
jgi:two-component system OmpR family sensor kinase/two-component system sensor histidine kinase BaeS